MANYSDEDDLMNRDVPISSTSLNNSAILDVPGRTTMRVHDMDVGDAVPIKQHPYRVNPQKRVNMQVEVGYMLHHGIAVLSQRSPLPRFCHVCSKLQIAFQTASGCKCRRSWCGSATGG